MTVLLVLLVVVGGIALALVAIAVFERIVPHNLLRRWWHISVPLITPSAGLVPGWALVETIGRKSGEPRRVPVGGRLQGRRFWFVVGHPRKSYYVRNIEQNPNVRVRVRGRWRTGVATLCPEDDPRRRMFWSNPVNGLFLWLAGCSEPLSVRVDLQ